eukprot:2178040-Rhodomonas_salina.1
MTRVTRPTARCTSSTMTRHRDACHARHRCLGLRAGGGCAVSRCPGAPPSGPLAHSVSRRGTKAVTASLCLSESHCQWHTRRRATAGPAACPRHSPRCLHTVTATVDGKTALGTDFKLELA